MHRIKRLLLLSGGLCALAGPVRADVIHLNDGSQIEGEIRKTEDGWVVTGADRKPWVIAAERVAFIEARPKAGVDSADQRLASLRHAVENTADIKQTLARYKTFIDQNPGLADKARADMQLWQDRLDRGLVRLGDKWLTRDEKDALVRRSDMAAGQALRLVKQSKLHEAGPLLDQILADNPQNAAAWYLKGVVLYRQDQLTPARKAFESVIGLLPDHAPSLNNIAVIYWRQNEPAVAVNFYDRALQAATNRHDILDNAAEALDALPEEYRNAPVTRKLVRHFNEQDALMQAEMQKQGLFRWGATWVTAPQLEKLKEAEKQIKDKLDKLSADFDAVTARIGRIDADIATDKQWAQRMEADSIGRDPATGVAVRYPPPPSYYDTLRDIKGLQDERVGRLAEQEKMRQAAKTIQQGLPVPKFTGLQRVIDADGAPISAAVLAAAIAAPPPGSPAPVPPPIAAPPVDPAPVAPPGTAPAPGAAPSAGATDSTGSTGSPQAGAPQAPLAQPTTAPSTGPGQAPLPRHTVVPPPKPSVMDRYP
jgi:tetratricopeptide (TPR) repeat protein